MKLITRRNTTIVLAAAGLLAAGALLTTGGRVSSLVSPNASASQQPQLPPHPGHGALTGTWVVTIHVDGTPPEAVVKWLNTVDAGGGWMARSSSPVHVLTQYGGPKLVQGGFSGNWWYLHGQGTIAQSFGAQFLFNEDQTLFGYDTLSADMMYDAAGTLVDRWVYKTYDVSGNLLLTATGSASFVRLTEEALVH
jgi:hypothetical protein